MVFFFLYAMGQVSGDIGAAEIVAKAGMLFVVFAALFVVNFIVKRNGLSKDSAYAAFFMMFYLLFFPSVLNNPNLLLSNFFILLALRRLISLTSLKSTKEKVFDASLWIFLAALFHFWSILFIVLVFISILFHVARDYRNWMIPFIAAFAILTIYTLFALIYDENHITGFLNKIYIDYKINYFKNINENLALSIFTSIAIYFVATMVLSISGKPQLLQPSYKKLVASFFIGVVIFVISPNKSNDLLIFTFAPLSVMATSHIESSQSQLKQEIILALFILSAFFLFFIQL